MCVSIVLVHPANPEDKKPRGNEFGFIFFEKKQIPAKSEMNGT